MYRLIDSSFCISWTFMGLELVIFIVMIMLLVRNIAVSRDKMSKPRWTGWRAAEKVGRLALVLGIIGSLFQILYVVVPTFQTANDDVRNVTGNFLIILLLVRVIDALKLFFVGCVLYSIGLIQDFFFNAEEAK
jgi:hypothetical protein